MGAPKGWMDRRVLGRGCNGALVQVQSWRRALLSFPLESQPLAQAQMRTHRGAGSLASGAPLCSPPGSEGPAQSRCSQLDVCWPDCTPISVTAGDCTLFDAHPIQRSCLRPFSPIWALELSDSTWQLDVISGGSGLRETQRKSGRTLTT